MPTANDSRLADAKVLSAAFGQGASQETLQPPPDIPVDQMPEAAPTPPPDVPYEQLPPEDMPATTEGDPYAFLKGLDPKRITEEALAAKRRGEDLTPYREAYRGRMAEGSLWHENRSEPDKNPGILASAVGGLRGLAEGALQAADNASEAITGYHAIGGFADPHASAQHQAANEMMAGVQVGTASSLAAIRYGVQKLANRFYRSLGNTTEDDRKAYDEQFDSALGAHEWISDAAEGKHGPVSWQQGPSKVDPTTVQTMSPVLDLTMLAPVGVSAKLASKPAILAATLEKAAQANLIEKGLAKTADALAGGLRWGQKTAAESPLVNAGLGAAVAATMGGDVSANLMGGLLGTQVKLGRAAGKVVGAAARAAEDTSSILMGKVPNGPIGKFSSGLYRTLAPELKQAAVGQLAFTPWLLGSDNPEEFAGMVTTGLGMHAGGAAVGKAWNGLDVSRNIWSAGDRMPEHRLDVKDLGFDPELDVAHRKVALETNNSGNNFLESVRSALSKKGLELYALKPADYNKAVDQLVQQGALSAKEGEVAKSSVGVTTKLKAADGTDRGIALSRVGEYQPGLSVGHEAGHLIEQILSPDGVREGKVSETLKSVYDQIAKVYGEEGLAQYKAKHEELHNSQLKPGETPMSLDRNSLLSEIFAEHASAILNSLPISKTGFKGPEAKTMVQKVYGVVGRALETMGARQPELSASSGARSVSKTGLGIDPSAKLSQTIENVLTAHVLDGEPMRGVAPEAEGATPAAKPAAPAAQPAGGTAGPLKNVQPVAPKVQPPIAKGDPVGDIHDAGGVLVGEDAVISGINGDNTVDVTFTHPDTGVRMSATINVNDLPVSRVLGGPLVPEGSRKGDTVFPPNPVTSETPPGARVLTEDLPVPRTVENTTRPQVENPNIRTSPEQQAALTEATPEVLAQNKQTLDKNFTQARSAQVPHEVDYRAASTDSKDFTPEQREAQRRQADALEAAAARTGTPNPLRSTYQKITIPFRWADASRKQLFAWSADKVVRNVDRLKGWFELNREAAAAHPEVVAKLGSPALLSDLRVYLENISNGYAGDGSRITRPADTKPGSVTPENPNYTPVKLDPATRDVLNLLQGLEQPGVRTPATEFARRFAEQNGFKPAEVKTTTGESVSDQNALRADLRTRFGFDAEHNTPVLESAFERINLNRIVSPVKARPDIRLHAGDTGIVQAGFMPDTSKQTESPEFKRWFGGSKVVDKEGEPLVVYHGTAADFTAFDPSKHGSGTDGGYLGKGHYFAIEPKHASAYASGFDGLDNSETVRGAKVLPVFVSLKNPAVGYPARFGESLVAQLSEQLADGRITAGEMTSRLQSMGHDGVMWLGNGPASTADSYHGNEVVAFEPTQIKSATGNRGTFDATNPDIRFMPATREQLSGRELEHSVGGTLKLVHYGDAGQKTVDPKNFGKSGLTPGSELAGLNRGYFYEAGRENPNDPVLGRGAKHEVSVSGNRIYDGDADPLGWSGMINRAKADEMLKAAGYLGVARTSGSGRKAYRQVEVFAPVKLPAPGSTNFMPATKRVSLKKAEGGKYWMSPEGDLHPVGKFPTHEEWAQRTAGLEGPPSPELIEQLQGQNGVGFRGSADLYKKGWVRVTSVFTQGRILSSSEGGRNLTRAQESNLRDLGIHLGAEGVQHDNGNSFRTVYNQNDPSFMPAPKADLYSQLEKTLEAIPEKASRGQIEAALRDGVKERGELKARPVKQEEMADVKDAAGTPFAEFLKQNPTATRQEMLDFAREGRVQVSEKTLGVPSEDHGIVLKKNHEETEYQDDGNDHFDVVDNSRRGHVMYTGDRQSATDYANTEIAKRTPDTKYENYVLPGGENYKEHVFTLPTTEKPLSFEQWLEKHGVSEEGYARLPEDVTNNLDISYKGYVRGFKGNGYTSSHFNDTPNYLAHARTNERTTADGESVLHMEESQSDLHQSGRKEGYNVKPTPEEKATLERELTKLEREHSEAESELKERTDFDNGKSKEEAEALREILRKTLGDKADDVSRGTLLELLDDSTESADPEVRQLRKIRLNRDAAISSLRDEVSANTARRTELSDKLFGKAGVPDAPFKKSWHELVFKKMLQKAAESGKDRLTWTTGEQQAARYDLSQQLDTISLHKGTDGKTDNLRVFDKNGRRVIDKMVTPDQVEDYVGKEMAKKLDEMPWKGRQEENDSGQLYIEDSKLLSGLDLKVGGEGMKGFYDQILPRFADKYLKRFGVKTEDVSVPAGNERKGARMVDDGAGGMVPVGAGGKTETVHSVRITPEMRAEFTSQGQPMYMPKLRDDVRESAAYREVARYLTPGELAGLRRDTAQNIVDLVKELPSDNEVGAMAALGIAKRGWYARAAKSIAHIFGPDTKQFATFLAALSPQQSVQENLRMAFEGWAKWNELGRPTDPDAVAAMLKPIVDLEARVGNGTSALTGILPHDLPFRKSAADYLDKDSTLSGFKVDSFTRNLLGELFAVTNDTWMAQALNVPQAKVGTKAGYLALTAKVRRVADKLGMQPAEVQETVWSFFKTLSEGISGGKTAKEVLHSISESDIAGTPEFYDSILQDPVVSKRLEELGLGGQLAGLREQHTETPRASGALTAALVEAKSGNSRILDRVAARAQRFSETTLKPAKKALETETAAPTSSTPVASLEYASGESPFMPSTPATKALDNAVATPRVGGMKPATQRDFTPSRIAALPTRTDWAILSAENPGGKQATAQENSLRNEKLQKDLREAGYDHVSSIGKYGQEEHGFIVTGISEAAADALGKKYGQHSVLVPRGLLYTDGSLNPSTGSMEVHSTEPKDYYTRIPGTKTFFTVGIDFDTKVPPADRGSPGDKAKFMPSFNDVADREVNKAFSDYFGEPSTFNSTNGWGFGGGQGDRWEKNGVVVKIGTAYCRHLPSQPFVTVTVAGKGRIFGQAKSAKAVASAKKLALEELQAAAK